MNFLFYNNELNSQFGTLDTFVLLRMTSHIFYLLLKIEYFQLRFLYRSDLQINTTEMRIKKQRYISHCYLEYGCKGTAVNLP